MAKALICTATLDLSKGLEVVNQAAEMAGVGCDVFVGVDENRDGGCKTANKGFKHFLSTNIPYLVYINDDTYFPRYGWLKRMIQELYGDRWVAGPSGKCGTQPQSTGKKGMPPGAQEVYRLSFFTAVFTRQCIEEIGVLDQQFIHYGCDSDYCERVELAGKKCVWVRDVWVNHEKGDTIKPWKAKDVATMRRKWGRA